MTDSKIWVDISHINGWRGNLTGIERVEYHLIKHYYDHPKAEFVIWKRRKRTFDIVERQYVKKTIIDRASDAEVHQKPILPTRNIAKRIYRKAKNYNRIPIKKEKISPGILIIPAGLWDNAGYIKSVRKLSREYKIIHVVYDMIPIVQKGYTAEFVSRFFKRYMYGVLPVCSGIITESESTSKDVRRVLKKGGLHVPEIESFRLGDDITRATTSKRPKKVKGEFLLTVGTIEARKNQRLLYYVQKKLLHDKKETIPIVVAGKHGWMSTDFEYMAKHDPETKRNIIILNKVTDAELRWLYENCLFTVFPSFYEGWGLPVAESLNYGKVTLASNTSSMPEVGGKFADYFSPFSTDQLTELITKYKNTENRENREKAIREGYKPLKWEDSAAGFDKLVGRLTS